jgi:hypothetical protein
MWLFGLKCLMIQLCNHIKWQINVGDDDDNNNIKLFIMMMMMMIIIQMMMMMMMMITLNYS